MMRDEISRFRVLHPFTFPCKPISTSYFPRLLTYFECILHIYHIKIRYFKLQCRMQFLPLKTQEHLAPIRLRMM